ncbi:MAG: NAD(P)/FAD-dependent oxidoreductase [Candidatus Pacebacteria bacterium]|nr:NAD(P)/FAD-dependent oxidoreductase [Candidatus Paceibacterota bacterium]
MVGGKTKYDCIVIGGGPAGMMAAIRSGELKKKVLLLEKNETLGNKLLLTGDGRCNLSHLEKDNKNFVEKFGKKGDFLLSPFSIFGPKKTFDFFENQGLVLSAEDDGRIFPKSNKAKDVLKVLLKLLKQYRVDILYGEELKKIIYDNSKIEKIALNNGIEIKAENYIIACGGKSYPNTGSNRSGFLLAQKLGHKIIDTYPALVPIKLKNLWIKDIVGISLSNIQMKVLVGNRKVFNRVGDILFTHFGITGPVVLNASNYIENNKVEIILDFFPKENFVSLKSKIQDCINANENKAIKNALNLLPERIIELVLKTSNISEVKKGKTVSKKEINILAEKMKNFEVDFDKLMDFNMAMVTGGGVDLREIDAKTMRSKIVSNLFFAGEIIDLIGETGGYNLQLCFTTGYVAGNSASSV